MGQRWDSFLDLVFIGCLVTIKMSVIGVVLLYVMNKN